MLIERQDNNEIVIKLSSDLNSFDFQRLIDYVRFLEIKSKSKAKQKDIDALANSVSVNWWKKNKKRFIK
jgi:hypothetical protein